MSEHKLVSPLLDGFVMGDPMSSHNGILCCPAMRENSEEKYIVKIISVPASQKQLDALLLTGAYPDAASATDYFKEVADGIVKEAELLKELSKLEDFLAYDNWQVVPMEGSNLGYQVYLISPYKRSLEKYLSRNTMTHLGAVNLGLDLCAALSICRRSGYMHVDLKPSNIYLAGQREFRIGDLGFVKLNALKYTSLPSKYCSRYTPAELHDPLNTLNPTADIYAVGMILYQIYNDGLIPYEQMAPATTLPAPLHADYELAEIILKACDPNPRKRYQTPIEMGQALVSYMQRNTITDTPIVPPSAPAEFMDAAVESVQTAPEETEATQQTAETISGEHPVPDETVPNEQDATEFEGDPVTDDVAQLLGQAEELLSEAPAVIEEPEVAEALEELLVENAPVVTPAMEDEDDEDDEEEPVRKVGQEKPKKKHGFLKFLIVLILLGAMAFGGYYYYQNMYLLHIDSMHILPFEDTVTVTIGTKSDESLLTVVCTDPYGNTRSQKPVNGQAVFEGLNPGTLYKVTLTAEGFHSLEGYQPATVTTAEKSEILDFSAINGTENGSVILSFTVLGADQDWIVEYTAEGEEPQSMSFTGHTVTVSGLTIGKTYTFSLVSVPGAQMYIVGDSTLEYTMAENVTAENLTITSCENGELTAQWNEPAGSTIDLWTVRCYNDNGYDETITTAETNVTFPNIAAETAYTVEVTAAGMTLHARTYISVNPATISDIIVDDTTAGKLTVTWGSGDVMPEGGWLLLYTLDAGHASMVVPCTDNHAVIEPTVPGATYHMTILPADGSTVFGGSHTYTAAGATVFHSKAIDGAKVTGSFCPTPSKSNWTYKDIADSDYRATYAPGSKVSMVLYSPDKADRANDQISVMFVIRDSEGNPLPNLTNIVSRSWNDLWNNRSRYCSLDLPGIPGAAGEYTVEVYFNRQLVITKKLTITE